ncbi:MAG: sulfotransferase family protein [Alphaproteobacteria bacterium]|nr:MAG: sulfotransferase family protein [Alphaproteobacteria bacterium]
MVTAKVPLQESRASSQAEELARRDQEIRRLKVSLGATFEELEAAGKVGGGRLYSFEELLFAELSRDTVPPLVFVHIPKTGGSTLNRILTKNYRWRLDSYGPDFFPRYYPDEFVALVRPPLPDDTRRPVFFTGHIDLANEIFRYMPVRYVAVTLLREPVQRIVSHYRFLSTLPNRLLSSISPLQREDMLSGKVTVVDFFRKFHSHFPLQYQIFAPTGLSAQVDTAICGLSHNISIFGLQERFDEFVVLAAAALGLVDILYAPINVTTQTAAAVSDAQQEELASLLVDDIRFYRAAVEIYDQRAASLPFSLKDRTAAFCAAKKQYLAARRAGAPHRWRAAYG